MAKFEEYGMACVDCVQAIANDDYSGVDYYLSATDAAKRVAEIQEGIARAGGWLSLGDEIGFSWRGCDVCGSSAGGEMHAVYVSVDEDATGTE